MRDRRHVANGGHGEACGLQRAQRGFTARTRTRNLDLKRAHAMFCGLAGAILGRHLRGVGRRFARALETHRAGGGPRDRVALGVCDGDHRIVERRIHVGDARDDVLAFAAANAGSFLGHIYFTFRRARNARRSGCDRLTPPSVGDAPDRSDGFYKPAKARPEPWAPAAPLSAGPTYFFLPAIGLALPLRVRALVCVRWPRTGS